MENISRSFTQRTQEYNTEIQQKLELLEKKKNDNIEKKKHDGQASHTASANLKQVEEKTFYYAKLRIQKRISDQTLVNQWYDLIDSHYFDICHHLCSDEAIITDDTISMISKAFSPIMMYPDLLLDLVTIFPKPNDVISQALDSNELLKPSESLVDEAFTYDPVTNQVLDAKYRYLINMQGIKIRHYLDDRESQSFNTKINAELFMQLSNQSRWNNLWIQIAVSLFYMDTTAPAKALQNTGLQVTNVRRYATDLVCYQSIAHIVRSWNTLPFSVRRDSKLDISSSNHTWTTSQIPLLYSLLELSKEERGCNVLEPFLTPMIRYRIVCAYTSFETETLDKKGIYSSMLKLISAKMQKYARIRHVNSMTTQRLATYDTNVEVFSSTKEMSELNDNVKQKCDSSFLSIFMKYLGKINSGTHAENTELCRWLSGILLTMGNAGIYYKTSLVLEKEKSVASQTLGTLNFPKPSQFWSFNDLKIDAVTDWSTGSVMYKEIANRYKHDAELYLYELDGNLQEWFYTLLTNRSQGFKVNVENFVNNANIDPELLKDLRNVGQVRVASFLLDNETYSDFDRYFETLLNDGVCTIRFQNNRRARIVEIVPNVDQIGYAIILKIFEELKVHTDEIAVGKQIGGIRDMALQLEISGLDNGVSIFSDVSAMDAHTQPNVAVMFLKMLSEVITERDAGPIKYFPFSTTSCIIHRLNPISQAGNYLVEQAKLPALSQTLLFIASQRLNKKYLLKDTVFNCTIEINPTIFESGRFDTSAQHTKLLKYSADVVYERVKRNVPGAVGKYIAQQRKFGDDSYECLQLNAISQHEQDSLINEIITATNSSLYELGLKAETELSSYYGDFLQQMAFCGVVIPKSARSSIYTDEKGSLTTRDVVDLITNLANIITASAQRTYAPENVMTLVRSIWAANRLFRMQPSKNYVINQNFKKYIRMFGQTAYLEYPYIMISLPPLNFPNQTFQFSNGRILPRSSWLRTVGLCKLNYVWNMIFTEDEKSKLLTVYDAGSSKAKVVSPSQYFIDELGGTDIVESMIFFKYKRSQELSESRYEKLKDPIIKMGGVAQQYFNQERLKTSLQSAVQLRQTYGITMPDSLLYYMKPVEQLKDMFATRAETADESVALNDRYIVQMNKLFATVPNDVETDIVNTCVFWESVAESVDHLISQIGQLPLLPGYHSDSDYFRAINMLGNSFTDMQRKNKALVSFTSRYGGTYNMEAIQKIGTQAKLMDGRGGNTAFNLFLDAMQLPLRVRQGVEEMFTNDETLLLHDIYKSGFQPEQMFAISDSTNQVMKYLLITDRMSGPASSTLTVMLRDWILLTSNKSIKTHKITPIMPVVTYM